MLKPPLHLVAGRTSDSELCTSCRFKGLEPVGQYMPLKISDGDADPPTSPRGTQVYKVVMKDVATGDQHETILKIAARRDITVEVRSATCGLTSFTALQCDGCGP